MRKLGMSLCLFCKKWLHIEHLTLTGKLLSTSLCLLFLCFCDLASLISRPPPSFSSLTEQNNRGRPGIIYHVRDVRVERRVERT